MLVTKRACVQGKAPDICCEIWGWITDTLQLLGLCLVSWLPLPGGSDMAIVLRMTMSQAYFQINTEMVKETQN